MTHCLVVAGADEGAVDLVLAAQLGSASQQLRLAQRANPVGSVLRHDAAGDADGGRHGVGDKGVHVGEP